LIPFSKTNDVATELMLLQCGQHAGADFTWLVLSYLISTAATSGTSAITYSASAVSVAFGDEQRRPLLVAAYHLFACNRHVPTSCKSNLSVAFVNATKKIQNARKF
jgi:hypothetical protein